MLYIGNPTNILLASAFDIRFGEYFKWMFLPAITAGFANMLLLYFIFRGKVWQPITHVEEIAPSEAITDKVGALLGLSILGGCIGALSVAPYFGIEMWTISFVFAIALLVILAVRDSLVALRRKGLGKISFELIKTLQNMPLSIIPFVIALFISVEALRIYGITEDVGLFFRNVCGNSNTLYTLVYGISSAFSANLLNNIPMTVAFVPISGVAAQAHLLPAVLATTIGSNLGANITPIGALAGIMWMSILREKEIRISFKEFVTYGLMATPITLSACLGVLALEFMIA